MRYLSFQIVHWRERYCLCIPCEGVLEISHFSHQLHSCDGTRKKKRELVGFVWEALLPSPTSSSLPLSTQQEDSVCSCLLLHRREKRVAGGFWGLWAGWLMLSFWALSMKKRRNNWFICCTDTKTESQEKWKICWRSFEQRRKDSEK